MAGFNDCFGDLRCGATMDLPHARRNAASAKARLQKAALSAQQTSMHLQRMTAIRPLLLITGTELFASFTIDWTMGGTQAVVSLRSGLRSGASPGFSGFAQ